MSAKDILRPDNATARWALPAIVSAAILALMSASCCILPIAFSILGVGGASLTMLGPFVKYRVVILAFASVIIALGWFWYLTTHASRLSLAFLLFATLSLALAITAPQWEGPVSQVLWTYWADTR